MEKPDEVFLFLHDVLSIEINDLTINSKLEADLGISGDDANYLLSSFADRFDVDISKFKIEEYFHTEPGFFSFGSDLKRNELTIKDLILAVDSGILI